MTKQALRNLYLQKRNNLSEAEYAHLNFQVYQNFFAAIDLSFLKVVHTFLPIPAKHEVDTWPVIDRIRREYTHIRISIPKVEPRTGTLENFYFEGLHQLVTNEWGIQEPKQGIPTESQKIDLVLVPLLAFDVRGNRVGYGKGFYDKFLTTCRTDCVKVGLSLFGAEKEISYLNAFDIRLNKCITPAGVVTF